MLVPAKLVPVSVEDLENAKIRDKFHVDSGLGGPFTVRFIRPTKYLITTPGWERIIEYGSVEEAAGKICRLSVD